MFTPPGRAWIKQAFEAKIAKKDGIVRRKKSDVEKYASFNDLLEEVVERQFHLIETGDQYVVLCNHGAITIHI